MFPCRTSNKKKKKKKKPPKILQEQSREDSRAIKPKFSPAICKLKSQYSKMNILQEGGNDRNLHRWSRRKGKLDE